MYNADSVSVSTIVYYLFMHLRATGKAIAPGAEDDPIFYPPKAARTRAIVDQVVHSSEGDRIDCCLYKASNCCCYIIKQMLTMAALNMMCCSPENINIDLGCASVNIDILW